MLRRLINPCSCCIALPNGPDVMEVEFAACSAWDGEVEESPGGACEVDCVPGAKDGLLRSPGLPVSAVSPVEGTSSDDGAIFDVWRDEDAEGASPECCSRRGGHATLLLPLSQRKT